MEGVIMEAKAIAKSVRISPRKAKLVIDLIRGKKIGEAIAIVSNVDSTVKEPLLKVINSAIANAVNNQGADANDLFIKEIYANPAPMLKRYRARAKGSGARILKRASHLTVVVADAKYGGHIWVKR